MEMTAPVGIAEFPAIRAAMVLVIKTASPDLTPLRLGVLVAAGATAPEVRPAGAAVKTAVSNQVLVGDDLFHVFFPVISNPIGFFFKCDSRRLEPHQTASISLGV